MQDVRRAIIAIATPQAVRVDILHTGQARLRVGEDPAHDVVAYTLEDLLLDAAASPLLSTDAYEQLHWELDMLAQHGQ